MKLISVTIFFAIGLSSFFCMGRTLGPVGAPKGTGVRFEENKGQVRDQFRQPRTDIDFKAEAPGMSIFIGDGQLHYQFFHSRGQQPSLHSPDGTHRLHQTPPPVPAEMYRMDVELVGADINAQFIAFEKASYAENYISPDGQFKVASFTGIIYRDIYPGIDWIIYSKDGGMKYEFVVHPGGNPSDIKIRYDGATALVLREDGGFLAETPLGTIYEQKPVSFQQDGTEVASAFRLEGNVLKVDVASYKGTLTIDPVVLWSSYFGGASYDKFNAVRADSYGAVYGAGFTSSINNVATTGAYQTILAGVYDGLLSKFDTSGNLIWSTYYGDADLEYFFSMHTDATSVYVAGDQVSNLDHDGLLVKFDSSGQMIWDHSFGSFGYDQCNTVLGDSWGNVYVGGTTESAGMATPGAFQITQGQGGDAFLAKLNSAGTIIWSTYFGDAGFEEFDDLAFDAGGNIVGVGGALSSGLNTIGPGYSGGGDALLYSFDTAGARLWCRYFGGGSGDYAYSIGLDQTGSIFMSGLTSSVSNIAAGPNPYQPAFGGGFSSDGFLAKFDNAGTVIWGTYFGGSGFDYITAIDVTSGGDVVLGGLTSSAAGIYSGPGLQPVYGGGTSDGFTARFSGAGVNLWSSYLGGVDVDYIYAITRDGSDNIYVAGYTESNSGIATPLSYQPANSGNGDAFITKLSDCPPLSPLTAMTGPASLCAGQSASYSVNPVPGAGSFAWTLPAGFTGTSSSNSINVVAGGSGGGISVTAGNGCSTTAPSSMSVNVLPVVAAVINAVANPAFCQGDSIILYAATGAGPSYQWLRNGIIIPGSTSDSLHVSTLGTYQLVVNPSGACSDTSAGMILTSTPLPAAPVVSSNGPVCPGGTIQLFANGAAGGSYAWSGPNLFSSPLQNPAISGAGSINGGVYSATVTVNGCTSPPSTVSVSFNTLPSMPSPISGKQTLCMDSTEIYAVVNDPSATFYTWSLPPGWTGSSNTSSILVNPGVSPGNISVAANNNCGGSLVQSVAVTSSPAPVATITNLSGVLITTAVFDTYQWYLNGNMVPGAVSQSYVPAVSGNYYVVVSDNVCTAQSNTLSFITGIGSIGKTANVDIIPNPNDGNFTARIEWPVPGQWSVTIMDIRGIVLLKQFLNINKDVSNVPIHLKGITPGLYLIKLEAGGYSSVRRFLVE